MVCRGDVNGLLDTAKTRWPESMKPSNTQTPQVRIQLAVLVFSVAHTLPYCHIRSIHPLDWLVHFIQRVPGSRLISNITAIGRSQCSHQLSIARNSLLGAESPDSISAVGEYSSPLFLPHLGLSFSPLPEDSILKSGIVHYPLDNTVLRQWSCYSTTCIIYAR
jgi:hypothetical protein